MNWLGVDIGGAHLKVADGNGYADSYTFPLWRKPNQLAQELRTLLVEAPVGDHLAVTMTGELADCFETKEAGVLFILNAVIEAAAGRHTRVYLTNGKMVTPRIAMAQPALTAASNWHALATYVARFVPDQRAILFDVGSTTIDLIPIVRGEVQAIGTNDTDRLLAGEMVYTGVERSPVCGLVGDVTYRGHTCPVAQEHFATTRDVYTLLEDLPERPNSLDTADGRPATKAASRARMARMICADPLQFNHHDAVVMAQQVAAAQSEKIEKSLRRILARLGGPPAVAILAGHGDFLTKHMLKRIGFNGKLISLSKEFGPFVSRSATAHALAVLVREATRE